MSRFDIIAFDADDTLWHNERLYLSTQTKFKQLLAQYHSPEWIDERLYQTEIRNLQHYGYGIKAFALSMIELAPLRYFAGAGPWCAGGVCALSKHLASRKRGAPPG